MTLTNVEMMKYTIEILNGNLRTPKIFQLKILIFWKNKNTNYTCLPINNSTLLSDSWLSGFIDADGSFSIKQCFKRDLTKRRIVCNFKLKQRMLDSNSNDSYESILTAIVSLFKVKLNRSKHNKNQIYYII